MCKSRSVRQKLSRIARIRKNRSSNKENLGKFKKINKIGEAVLLTVGAFLLTVPLKGLDSPIVSNVGAPGNSEIGGRKEIR